MSSTITTEVKEISNNSSKLNTSLVLNSCEMERINEASTSSPKINENLAKTDTNGEQNSKKKYKRVRVRKTKTKENNDDKFQFNSTTSTITSSPEELNAKKSKLGNEQMETEIEEPATARDALLIQRVVVMPINYPDVKFSEDETKKMEKRILELIDNMNEDDEVPQFQYRRLENGYWKVACLGESCRNWLVREISTWQYMSSPLKVIPFTDLPKPPAYKIWIPGEPMQNSLVLSRLRKQNKGIVTDKWRITGNVKTELGFLLFLEIDHESDNLLKGRKFLLFFGMTQIKFELIKQSSVKAVESVDQHNSKKQEEAGEHSSVVLTTNLLK